MGVPKTIRQLGAKGSALALTDLFAICAPSPALTDAVSVTGQDIVTLVGSVVANANNGLMNTGALIQLGQPVGQAGDPAALLHTIEIPADGHVIFIGRNNGVDDAIVLDPVNGIALGNSTGGGLIFQWTVTPNNTSFQLHTDDGIEIIMNFGGASDGNLIYTGVDGTVNQKQFLIDSPFVATTSYGQASQNIINNHTLTDHDGFLECDATLGNIVLDGNAANLKDIIFTFIKTDASVNTVTLSATGGSQILAIGGLVASVIINTQGQSIRFKSNGINFLQL